ncbi:MAG: hypothetical protein OEW04_10870 [Nitrospirota bacterium]|nr:hypothetical protein [Nitrospirota bacterium]
MSSSTYNYYILSGIPSLREDVIPAEGTTSGVSLHSIGREKKCVAQTRFVEA